MVSRTGDEDKMIPLVEAARQRNISEATLHSAIRLGNLPAEKIGRDVFVKLSDIDAALATGKLNPGKRGRPPKQPQS